MGSGSVYTAGYMHGTGTFDFGNGVNAKGAYAGYNGLLVKYSSSGIAQWAQTTIAGNNSSLFYSISVASDGSVYTAGIISGIGAFDFGNGVNAKGAYTGYNGLLVKYNSSGTAQWAQTVLTGNDDSSFNSVSVSTDGSVYAAGNIHGTGTFSFGNGVTAKGIYENIFPKWSYGYQKNGTLLLVKYTSSGVAQWAQTVIAGNDVSFFNSITIAADESIYAGGVIYGTDTFDFGNGVTAKGMSQPWLDSDGGQNVYWITQASVVLVKYLKQE